MEDKIENPSMKINFDRSRQLHRLAINRDKSTVSVRPKKSGIMSMVKNKPVSLDIPKDEWSLQNIKTLFSCQGCTGYQKSTIQASIISEQESGELSEGEIPTPTKVVIVPEEEKLELDPQFVVQLDNSPVLKSPTRNIKLP